MRTSSLHLLLRSAFFAAFALLAISSGKADKPPEPTADSRAEQIAANVIRSPASRIIFARSLELSDVTVTSWDLSADGTRLVAADAYHRLAVWDLSGEPTKLWELPISPLVQPDSILKISRNGEMVLLGARTGDVVIYDAASGKTLYTHQTLRLRIVGADFAMDGERIFAIDEAGNSFVTFPTQDGEVQPGPETPEGVFLSNPQMNLIGAKFSWKLVDVGQETQQWFAYEKHALPPIKLKFPISRAIFPGPRQIFVGHGNEFAMLMPLEKDGVVQVLVKYEAARDLYQGADFTSDGRWIWMRGGMSLQIGEGTTGRAINAIVLPPELIRTRYRTFPDARLICKPNDLGLEIWKVTGNPVQSQMAGGFAIAELLDNQRMDVIELLAKKWDGLTDNYLNREHETPTSFLMTRLQAHTLPGETLEERNERYLKWIEENPDNCQFLRIAMCRIYLADGYRARGPGFADTVTDEGWQAFYANMAKMWKVIEPIYDDEQVPAEAYTCAIIAGKNLQWERDEVDAYLQKSFAKWPNYHRTYAEEAVARLPRWGGAPEDTGEFVKELADKIGGDDGEIMYAQVCRHVINFVGFQDLPTETGLSQERMVRGMALLSQRTSDPFLWNQTLNFAAVIEEEESMRSVCELFVDSEQIPNWQVWPRKYDSLDKIYAKARGITNEDVRRKVEEDYLKSNAKRREILAAAEQERLERQVEPPDGPAK